jgi:D-3-phosphoglycerate dehydrogenase
VKVYVLDRFHPAGVEHISRHAEVVLWDDPAVAAWPEEADGVMVRMSPITSDHLARARRLKVICKQGVGIDTIDVAAARRHGITVCRTPGVNSEAVAELAFTLALSVLRRTAEFDRMIRSGEPVERARFLGIEAWQKTVGVVGMGAIGTRVARKWHGAFEAKLLAYDPHAPAEAWQDLPHERLASLDGLLSRADILTLHLPLTTESRNMIDGRALGLMKPSAVIVNVSRGGIVHEGALYEAISQGRLFGAGLDVFEVEPPTADHPLARLPTVVMTPHAGGGTRETQERSSVLVAQQVLDVLAGKEPIARVA